jgi:hypothetical protein
MTNFQSKFRSVTAGFLSLIVFAAIIVGIYLDVNHTIQNRDQAGLQQRLIILTVLMTLPGVITAFLLGFSVRVATNPKTRWLIPSILVGAGVGITFRAVANKIQSAEQPQPHTPPLAAPEGRTPLGPPPGARRVDTGDYHTQLAPAPAPGGKTPWSLREIFGLSMSKEQVQNHLKKLK